ncbi:UDP-glucose/GDP-mannose dehydrogenase family protein [Patescibacteria group bacterium]|nr:UDP-glucose/GDP-mannose dehydrogenase family protein [Patescibacteria group bacterium]MBU1890852.1 UDP-glucose/GDP-mannose dehydrogenase family protein [Patescibacteria group bacterium]
MKISVIGTGYVGLVTGTCLSEIGYQVICLDIDEEKITRLKEGIIPIYEPQLKELVIKNQEAGRLSFTTSYAEAINDSAVVFIAVGTPAREDGHADLSYVFQAAESIAQEMKDYKVIVDKSTVPVGTGEKVKSIIQKHYSGSFDVVSCPEFLREGSAIEDFMKPDRIVVGAQSTKAVDIMFDIFKPIETEKISTNLASAELIKYASNAFLATKISFINEISNICDLVGANVGEVAYGMGLDQRIGSSFLRAGVGYGGSCFPKDVSALKQMAGHNGYDFKLLKAVIEVNNDQRAVVIKKAKEALKSLKGKNIGILGLAFKDNTDDVRESAAIDIINLLQKEKAQITAYDPIATKNAEKLISGIEFSDSAYAACHDKDLVIIATEWPDFKELDWEKIKDKMRNPCVVDGRNLLDQNKMREIGFQYLSIGR